MKIEEYIPLLRLTTMKTGGAARYVVTASGEHEVKTAVQFAAEKKLPVIPLGAGSNMLAPDDGVEAVFMRMSDEIGIHRFEEVGGGIQILVSAGVPWDSFVDEAVSRGWWGIENLSGIPGTIGAAAVQNIGAYGMALSESVVEVFAYDLKEHALKTFSHRDCLFGYRTSVFKEERDRYFIARIRFRLSTTAAPRLSYRDITEHFTDTNEEPSLLNIRHAVLAIRMKKFPPLDTYGTAGSFFMNPVLPEATALTLKERFPGMPLFSMPEGGVKVPLAWILDRVLNMKGERVGGAFLWNQQPIVIATETGATTRDVLMLADRVRSLVKEKIHIDILPEVRTVFK